MGCADGNAGGTGDGYGLLATRCSTGFHQREEKTVVRTTLNKVNDHTGLVLGGFGFGFGLFGCVCACVRDR